MDNRKAAEKSPKFDLSIKPQRVEVARADSEQAAVKARVVVVTMA